MYVLSFQQKLYNKNERKGKKNVKIENNRPTNSVGLHTGITIENKNEHMNSEWTKKRWHRRKEKNRKR